MIQSIIGGAPQQIPASKAFEPNQAPSNPNNITQPDGPSLKPQKVVEIPQNPALNVDTSSSSRGSNLDISV
jgi:hypothetical protein